MHQPDSRLTTTDNLFLMLVFLICLTISWDIVLTFEFNGTWRVSNLLMLPIILCAPYYWLKSPKQTEWNLLILLAVLNFIATSLNETHLRGWLYAGWFFYFVGFVVGFSGYAKNHIYVLKPLIFIFFFAAFLNMSFGLIQFIGGLFGLELWATQKLWPWGINRISGFTFEPSYYVTYIYIFWVSSLLITEFQFNENLVMPIWLSWATLITSTLGILLATSRMGWLFMLPIAVIYPIRLIIALAYKRTISGFLKAANTCILLGFTALSIWIASDFESFRSLFLNAGLFGYGASNANVRISGALDAFQVFQVHWFFGAGYGELPFEIMLLNFGEIFEEKVQIYLGGAPLVELASATGIIGLSIFILFMLRVTLVPLISWKKQHNLAFIAFAAGFLVQFAVLQLNQNLFRGYIWLSLAILITLYQLHETKNTKRVAAQ